VISRRRIAFRWEPPGVTNDDAASACRDRSVAGDQVLYIEADARRVIESRWILSDGSKRVRAISLASPSAPTGTAAGATVGVTVVVVVDVDCVQTGGASPVASATRITAERRDGSNADGINFITPSSFGDVSMSVVESRTVPAVGQQARTSRFRRRLARN
jgi:hypothetical protein